MTSGPRRENDADEVVLVEAADGGRDLRLVVVRAQPRGPRVEPLGGVLVALALQQRALHEQRIGPRRLEERIEAVLRLKYCGWRISSARIS